MGQLEKYGLYVLCLVIFMILGVALWGDPAKADTERDSRRGGAPISAPGNAPGSSPAGARGKDVTKAPPAIAGVDLDQLLGGGKEKPAQGPGPSGGNGNAGSKPVEPSVAALETKRSKHVIKPGESFESIARTQLKDVKLRDLIMQLNPDVPPSRMQLGKEIVLPSPAEIAALRPLAVKADGVEPKPAVKPDGKAPEAKPVAPLPTEERLYTVQKGDSFERIAHVELGSKKRTAELMGLNPGIKAESLRKGQRIKLPKK